MKVSKVNENGSLVDSYSNFIAVSRYARWMEDKGRRETWQETVERYMAFMKNHLVKEYNYDAEAPIFKRVEQAILNHEVMPSMRSLMTAGPALERDNIAGYNPVVGGTKVLTREFGEVAIGKLSGTTAEVVNKDGKWADAEFHSYGVQDTFEVSLHRKNSQSNESVVCTANHRWIKTDGEVVPTSSLMPGDHIPFATAPRPDTDNIDYRLGIIHGLVYGDGTTTYSQERTKGYHIRICGDGEELLPYFDEHGVVCYPPSANGDPVVMLYGAFAKTHSLKTLPSKDETESYLLGFFRGWFAADGSIGKNSNGIVLAANEESVEWANDVLPRIGILTNGAWEMGKRTNFGDRKHRTFSIYLSRSSMVEDDFLISRKRKRFVPLQAEFIVDSVIATGEKEEVFCAEVPDTNTFTLSGGVVTGNCSFIAVDNLRAFDEAMYILMNGTGVGFSVEQKYIAQLPIIADEFYDTSTTIVVEDSKLGWAKAYKELISLLATGQIPKWNMDKVRPAGARLKTFGGRASGPAPLKDLFKFTVATFENAKGRRLKPIEAHDLMCKVGEIVVVGGVRRSALISLSNLDDFEMAKAKSGQWWESDPQRALANNSAVYNSKPSVAQFLREWRNLYESKSGERGIYNMDSVRKHIDKFGRRDSSKVAGTNPCGEILLRANEFCNLTEVVISADDTEDTLRDKVKLATILGTWQSTLTNFKYIRKSWKANCEEERLLGVSLTGIFGNTLTNHLHDGLVPLLASMRAVAVSANKGEAERLGINESASITCVKPSGTVSQLTGVSSGIHPWYSEYYLRSVRADNKDPLTQFLKDSGIPNEPDVMKPDTTTVFSFPIAAPKGATLTKDFTAIEHLELWKAYREHWTEHNPSVTINVHEDEWMDVGAWVFDNFDAIGGVSFLPATEHTYAQAPYIEISEVEYALAVKNMPSSLTWEMLSLYEKVDGTTGSQELACSAAGCDQVDIVSVALPVDITTGEFVVHTSSVA